MSVDNIIGPLAPIISAIISAIGVIYITDILKRRNERISLHNNLVHKYMFQLQYMAESLWYRFHNLAFGSGALYMKYKTSKADYFVITTLYALGSMLAHHRIMLLDGTYAELENIKPKSLIPRNEKYKSYSGYNFNQKIRIKGKDHISGAWIKERLDRIDNELDRFQKPFFKYDRLYLAEALIKRGSDNRLYISTYLEFVKENGEIIKSYINKTREPSNLHLPLDPAIEFVMNIKGKDTDNIMKELENIIKRINKLTEIPTTIDFLKKYESHDSQ